MPILVDNAVAVAVGPTRFGQQRLRLLRIVVVLGRDLVGGVGVGDDRLRPLRHLGVAELDVVDDCLPVERVQECLPHPLILPVRGHVGIEIELVVGEVARWDSP